jgi:hypothetical protein
MVITNARILPPMALLIALVAGCGGETCRVDVASGTVEALVNGDPYGASVVHLVAGDALQLSATPNSGWWFSLVLQADALGGPAAVAVEDEQWPVEIELGEGGFATVYTETGGSGAARTGHVTLVAPEVDGTLAGCFQFTVDDGTLDAEFTEGAFAAPTFAP